MNENVFWALKDFENTWFFSSIVDFLQHRRFVFAQFYTFSPQFI